MVQLSGAMALLLKHFIINLDEALPISNIFLELVLSQLYQGIFELIV